MSKVTFKIGKAQFSFETNLQYVSEEQIFQLEEKLLMEIKQHKRFLTEQLNNGYIHDVVFEDEHGYKGKVNSFEELGNMKIEKSICS